MKNICYYLVLSFSVFLLAVTGKAFAHGHLAIDWQFKYGFIFDDFGTSIVATRDGGYLMAGQTKDDGRPDSHGSTDVLLIKLDKNGVKQWDRAYGGSSADGISGKKSLIATVDGGFIVCATTSSHDGQVLGSHDSATNGTDAWVFKVNSIGNLLWSKCLGGSASEAGVGVVGVSDTAVLVLGYTNSNNGDIAGIHGAPVNNGNQYFYDIFVAKMDLNGNLTWLKTYGGSQNDFSSKLEKTNDGNFMIVGQTQSFDGDITSKKSGGPDKDVWLFKVDGTGNIIWDKCVGGSGGDIDCSLIQKPNDPNYILAMTNYSIDGDFLGTTRYFDFNFLKMDSVGNVKWLKSYGGSGAEAVTDLAIMRDGSFMLCGETYSTDGDVGGHKGSSAFEDSWIINVDDTGKLLYTKEIGGSDIDYVSRMLPTSDTGAVMVGFTNSVDGDLNGSGGRGDYDFWVIKVHIPTPAPANVECLSARKFELYPTLANEFITIKAPEGTAPFDIVISDMAGNFVLQSKAQSNFKLVDVSSLCPGMYTVTLSSKHHIQLEKFSKL